jgi:molybdopterin synthase sulfur carrier subunit
MATVTMRYWAAAKDAAGVAEQRLDADTLAAALTQAAALDAAGRLQVVLARSSFIIDGDPVGRRTAESVALSEGSVIEVLPPFAGG